MQSGYKYRSSRGPRQRSFVNNHRSEQTSELSSTSSQQLFSLYQTSNMGAPKNNNLTPRDLEVAAFVWRCFKTEPTIDFAALAKVAHFKNAASASACWGATKKKLLAQGRAGGSASTATASPATPKPDTPKPASTRKRKTADTPEASQQTPSKKGKTTPPVVDDDDEYGDIGDVKEEPKGEDEENPFADGSGRKDSFF
ncbi:hypothetical protein HDK64DRAFT_266204, partial [Phyllosticta capitalensis]